MLKRTMKAILCLSLYMFLGMEAKAEPMLLDRLIVEVSGKSYSQKQLELYVLLRTIAMGEPARSGLPAEENWTKAMESFKNEMIVVTQLENDQTNLDSFMPDPQKTSEALKALNEAQGKDKEVDAFIRQRGLSDADLMKVLTTVFRVEGYARSRMQLAETRTSDDKGPKFVRLDPEKEWFQTLQKSTAYRYYLGAKDFKPLVPLR